MTRRRPTYSVYVIELQAEDYGPAEVYVGSTALPPEERLQRHLAVAPGADERAGSGVVRRRFRRLRPDLAAGIGPFRDRPSARRAELALRRRLERRGYKVRGACGKGCSL